MKYRIYFIVLAFCLFSLRLYSQTEEVKNKCRAYYHESKHDSLLTYINEYLEKEQPSGWILRMKGDILRNSSHYENAIATYKLALEVNKNDKDAFNGLGITYAVTEKNDSAIWALNNAYIIDPNYSTTLNNRSSVYYMIGDYKKAYKDIQKSIKLDSEEYEAYFNRGLIIRYLNNRHYKSIKDFKKALIAKPEDSQIYYEIAESYYLLGYTQKAIDYVTIAIEKNQFLDDEYKVLSQKVLYEARSEYYSLLGKEDEAKKDLLRAASFKK